MAKTEMGSKDETIIAQQLKMQFHGTRKEDRETIESYVKKLKSTAASLTAIGSPISDQDLVLQLLAGLPSQYLLLKNTISSQLPLPNFSEACSMLYEYEKSSIPTSHGANQSANNNNNNNSSKSTVEMIHDIASTVTTVASIAREFWNGLGPWSGSHSSGTDAKAKAKAAPANKKYYRKGHTGGRGNNKRGGGGPSTNTNNNSDRK